MAVVLMLIKVSFSRVAMLVSIRSQGQTRWKGPSSPFQHMRKGAWPFYRTSSGFRLWWELEESQGPKRGERGGGRLALTPDNNSHHPREVNYLPYMYPEESTLSQK